MRRLLALVLVAAAAVSAQQRTPIILDTDLGDAIDDALALAFALNSPELDVRAITTVMDDGGLKARLAWKMMGLYNRRDIALAQGASEPLLAPRQPSTSRQYSVLTADDTIPEAARQPAASLIVGLARRTPGISIAAIGPLTNIALALKLDPSIKSNIARIYLMGGAYQRNESEYNVARDPHAAQIVFASGIPITAVGLEVTRDLQLSEDGLGNLRLAGNPAGLFLLRLLDLNGEERPTLYDPLALAVIFQPDLVRFREGTVSVSLEDGLTRFAPADRARTVVGEAVDVKAALALFSSRFARGEARPLR